MEPPVSEPRETGQNRAATAAAEPPLLPPGTRSVAQGLTVFLSPEFSVLEPIANSSMFVLPTITASASRNLRIAVASYGAWKFSRMREPQVVAPKLVHITSLTAMGTPASIPTGFTGRDAAIHIPGLGQGFVSETG